MALVLAGVLFICAFPASAAAFPGAAARQTWSNGTPVTGAFGVKGKIRAYPRPTYGLKVSSMYIRKYNDPYRNFVEVGYTATGANPPSNPDGSPIPANHDPWLFTARAINEEYKVQDFYDKAFPVNGWTEVSLRNTSGNDNWYVYYGSTKVLTWWDITTMILGEPWVGQERSISSIDARASQMYMQYFDKDGSTYTWYDWRYGRSVFADQLNPSFYWRTNLLDTSAHKIYCDDHTNY
jgi:hypothetical protein